MFFPMIVYLFMRYFESFYKNKTDKYIYLFLMYKNAIETFKITQ